MNNNTLQTYTSENQDIFNETGVFFNPLNSQVIEGVPTHINETDSDLGSMVIMSGN